LSALLERFAGSPLRPIAEKVAEGRRLSFEDGVALFRSLDVLGVGALANHVREAKHGNTAYYNVNRYLNPTNLCWVDCALCAWARKPGVDGGYTMSIEEAVAESAAGWHDGITELHIVGGLHPSLPYSWYLDLLRALKARFPGVHLKAWTMVEIDWIARVAKQDVATVIRDLREAGQERDAHEDDRHPRRPRLQNDNAERFVGGGQDEDLGRPVGAGQQRIVGRQAELREQIDAIVADLEASE